MCQSPITLPNGQVAACRRCPQCVDLAINDWVGRNIAESKTSVRSHAVGLSYGRVQNEVLHERAVILTYSDPQKWFKVLRRHGYSMRYLITGEFGRLKGRAHWHGIIHWQSDKIPQIEMNKRRDQAHWEHGFSFWQDTGYDNFSYICKYIMKDQGDDERQGHLAMSKKPPLGAKYFAKLAWKFVEQGIAPQDLDYNFPDVVYYKGEKAGQRRQFRLKGRSADLFLAEFVDRWAAVYGVKEVTTITGKKAVVMQRRTPSSQLVDEFLDKGAWRPGTHYLSPFMRRDDHPDRVPKTRWFIQGMDDWEQEFEAYWNGKER